MQVVKQLAEIEELRLYEDFFAALLPQLEGEKRTSVEEALTLIQNAIDECERRNMENAS